MKIAIIGSTLQAGVLTALLSKYGNEVYVLTGVDRGENKGEQSFFPHLQDPQLLAELKRLEEAKSFKQLDSMAELMDLSTEIDCYFLSFNALEKSRATDFLEEMASRIAENHIEQKQHNIPLLINGSTFGLYGTEALRQAFPEADWAYLPDIVQEGNAVKSFIDLAQLIVGIESEQTLIRLKELFRPFFPLPSQWLVMPILDAELTKLSISGMLATRISYMNDLANVAESIGVDILNVKQGLAADRRIGGAYLSPGAGFGGENFSSDILMLSEEVGRRGVKSRLMDQVWEVNEDQKEVLFRHLWRYYESDLAGKKVAIWGASFKEETASIYNSPIHKMIRALVAQGVTISLFDPAAMPAVKSAYPFEPIDYCDDKYQTLEDADALIILTAWKEFFSPDYTLIKEKMAHPFILDGRNIFDPHYMQNLGFIYKGIGR
ncbi:UDP-glucose 6-dehydrogenase [Ignatzschineria indica]|uniref:UDP-glucose 6-dehydrogenase n=1 Tax=Ignatzschineria indica TaxID=472583 RepID=A0A2U2AMY1_9GAMM|nr:nucleotide sugar dehydrogenase [Ignatzschineria indica]PWD84571.1 UDP-glucose 6-dehydrogenase [Ignatzschineria indica]GGZ77546.1 UDP-glucose 6-dehydrogenase [Ignatzschineria indica]